MKKFVSMELINGAFDDLEMIDYILVSKVTDSQVSLEVHLKTFKVPAPHSREFGVFNERCVVLGKMLDRTVMFRFLPEKWYVSLFKKIFRFT